MCLPRKVKAANIQTIAATVGNLMSLNFGLMFGITPAHRRLYQSPESPLKEGPIDDNGAMWITDNLLLSTIIGCLVLGLGSERIGPRCVLIIAGLLQMSSWFCIHFANEIVQIHCARIAAGLAAGGAFAVLPVFVAEMSEEPHRSSLLPSIDQWRALGILVGFTMGSNLDYDHVNLVGLGISLAFNLFFPFIPESPRHFMRRGDVCALEKSLRWYRGLRHIDDRNSPEFLREFAGLKAEMLTLYGGSSRCQTRAAGASFAIAADTPVPRSYFLRVLAICMVLMVGAQLSGLLVILSYVEDICDIMDLMVSVEVATVSLAVVHFLGTILGPWLAEKIQRKLLLCITLVVSGMSLLCLSLFLAHANDLSLNPLHVPWLPLGLLILHILMASMGILCVATKVIVEILPSKLRTTMMSSTTAVAWLSAFAFIRFFHPLIDTIGWSGCLYVFATCCFFVAAFVYVCLPETKGKSLEEVHQEMGYTIKGSVAKSTIFSSGQFRTRY